MTSTTRSAMRILIVLLYIALALVACLGNSQKPRSYIQTGEETIKNIERIFMNQPGYQYTLLISKFGPHESIERTIHVGGLSWEPKIPGVVYKYDVASSDMMWAQLKSWEKESGDWPNFATYTVEFHIHDVSEIEGGGWSRRQGKIQVHGNTTVVQ